MEETPNASSNSDLIYGVFCYLGILWVVSLLINKKNDFFRLHLGQGFVILILEAVLWILNSLPILRYVANWLWFLPGLLSLIAIIKILTGDSMYHLPVVSDISKNFKF